MVFIIYRKIKTLIIHFFKNLTGLQGLPTAIQLSGISLTTTLPAPIVTLLPIRTCPTMVTLAPKETLSPITGRPLDFAPKVVQCIHEKFSPIDSAFKIVA